MTRILLVEDDAMLQDILEERLELRNFGVILATNGQEGVEKAQTENAPLPPRPVPHPFFVLRRKLIISRAFRRGSRS